MTVCTERAVFVSDRRDAEQKAPSCDRFYLGSETCEVLIPTPKQVAAIQELASAEGRALTVVTPACTDAGLSGVRRTLAAIAPGTEVVFNDWGALEIIKAQGGVPVLGRLLVKIPRGFHRANLAKFPPELSRFVEHSNLDNPEFLRFLFERGVDRVELDNLAQGYSFSPDDRLSTSLYLPYVYMASGRKCIYDRLHRQGVDGYRTRDGESCARGCRDLLFHGPVGSSDEMVLMSQNAFYYQNDVLPPDLEQRGTDRIVDCSLLGCAQRPKEQI